MKRLLIFIFFLSFGFVSNTSNACSIVCEKIISSVNRDEQELEHINRNCSGDEIEINHRYSATQYISYKLKNIAKNLFSPYLNKHPLFCQYIWNINYPADFINVSTLLLFPFHNFW